MSIFDSSYYYRLTNDLYGSERPMSCYSTTYPPHDVKVSAIGRFTSENWQFWYQNNVYFIRNRDYNTTFHLGVERHPVNPNSVYPIMLPATTQLNQQWVIDKWSDGTYRLVNRLVTTNGTTNNTFMGVGESWNQLQMLSTEPGSKWTIKINVDSDIDRPTAAMQQPYDDIEVTYGATQTTGSRPVNSTTALPPGFSYSKPGQLSGLEKGALAVGVIMFFILCAIGLFLFRRYKKQGTIHGRGVPGPTPSAPGHGRAEVVQEPPPTYQHSRNVTSWASQSSTLNAGISGHYGRKSKAADEESIELPAYGRPEVESRSFV